MFICVNIRGLCCRSIDVCSPSVCVANLSLIILTYHLFFFNSFSPCLRQQKREKSYLKYVAADVNSLDESKIRCSARERKKDAQCFSTSENAPNANGVPGTGFQVNITFIYICVARSVRTERLVA